MPVSKIGTNALASGLDVSSTNISYTGTLTGGTGVVNIGSGQVYKDASGNVGIGTSSTPAKVTVATTSSTGAPSVWGTGQFVVSPGATTTSTGFGISVDTANNVTYVSSLTPGAAWRTLGYRANEHIFFSIGTNESARIDSSGNLLVGKTGATINSAGQELGSYAGFTRSGDVPVFVQRLTNTGDLIQFRYNASAVVGSISTNGTGVTYGTSSDYRLKENIAPMTGALARVAALKPCTYTWKSDGSAGEGFIAHELQQVCPDAVSGEKDAVNEDGSIKPQSIDTSFLVATLTAAIQELKSELDSVKAELAVLKGV